MLAQAVILCGGLGTRLGDLTRETPKPLLPVGDRPFLEQLIQEIARFGVTEIVLLAGRFGDKVSAAFAGRRLWGASIRVLVEPMPLGTGGALKFAEDLLDEVFFVLNGDSWVDADLVEVALHWTLSERQCPGLAGQMLLRDVPDARRYGSVIHENDRVRGFSEKREGGVPAPGLVNAGVYILRKSLIASLESGRDISLERDVFPGLARDGRIMGHVCSANSFFIDIGVPDDYARAQSEVPAARTRAALFFDRGATLIRCEIDAQGLEAIEWAPGAREAVAKANRAGRLVFLMGGPTGAVSEQDGAASLDAAVQANLFEIGAHVDAFGSWGDHKVGARAGRDGNSPRPDGIAALLASWPVDRERSLAIGANESDLAAARSAGLRSVLHDGRDLAELVTTFIAD